jgi:glycosyltransferase involved in cell wall biosynthesis
MRILIATWSSRQVGGTETYLARIASLLRQAGHDIAFAHEGDEPADRPRLELPADVESICLTASGVEAGLRAARAWRPDVVYAHGFLDASLEAGLQALAPAVFFAHSYYGTCISGEKTHKFPVVRPCGREFGPACVGLYYPRRCGGLSPVTMARDYSKQRRRRTLLARYAAVVTSSEHMRREFIRHGAADGRVFNCAFPLTGPDVTVGANAGRNRSPSSPWRLAFLGRMERLKGGASLIEALPLVRREVQRALLLTLAGDGPERGAWEDAARALEHLAPDVEVRFTGWLQAHEMAQLLEVTDLVVMPSLWPEPYGLAGTEANRRGVPVVAYAVGGIPEWLVDGVNGCLAPGEPPTVAGLAEATVRCLRVLSTGDELRAGALARGRSSDDAHVEALLGVFREALERDRSKAAGAHG